MKKLVYLALGLLMLLLAAGCGAEGNNEDVSQERDFSDKNCGYVIPAGWVKSDKYSTDDKVFYVPDGHEDDEQPDNISVEIGTNKYAADEHVKFREAIVRQLAMQLQGVPGLLTGDGRFTDNEDVLYVFTFREEALDENGESEINLPEEERFVGVTTRQYYVVGENKYALIHLGNFSGSEETDAAAERMATSFCWAEQDA